MEEEKEEKMQLLMDLMEMGGKYGFNGIPRPFWICTRGGRFKKFPHRIRGSPRALRRMMTFGKEFNSFSMNHIDNKLERMRKERGTCTDVLLLKEERECTNYFSRVEKREGEKV